MNWASATAMAEVSLRAFSYFENVTASGAVASAELTLELAPDRAEGAGDAPRFPWDVWVDLLERTHRALGSDEALVASAVHVVNAQYSLQLVHLASLLKVPRDVYRLGLMWGAPGLFRTVHFEVGEADPSGAFEVTHTLEEGFAPSRAWLLLVEGVLAVLPRFVGAVDSRVERIELEGARGRWRVVPAVTQLGQSEGERADPDHVDPERVLEELISQQRQLSAAWSELRRTAHAQRNLERSEATVRALLKVFPDLVLRVSTDGTLLDVQGGHSLQGAETLKGAVGARLDRSLLEQLGLTPSMAEQLIVGMGTAVREERMREISLTGSGIDGRPRSLLVRVVPVEDQAFVILNDDTQRREVERRLIVAERMSSLGTLAAGVAHEINNPLTYILTNMWVVRETFERTLTGADREEMLAVSHEIEEGARRIRDSVARMRELSRVEPTRRELVSPRFVLERALKTANNQLRHRATVVTEIGETGSVLGDPNALTQVFVNLLVNAAEAIPETDDPTAHAVRVTLREEGSVVVVDIADTGAGIAPEYLGRVFDPFFTTKTSASGTGLGLAVVHRTVSAMRGSVQVISEPGHGALFRVTLPVLREAESTHVPPLSAPASAARIRIVIIDDDALVSRSLLRALTDHDVVAFADGEKGLEAILANPPDLVLCDLMMPGLSGIGIWERVSNAGPDLLDRITFMTGGAFTERAERFLAETKARVLQKPVPAADLHALIAERARAHAEKAP